MDVEGSGHDVTESTTRLLSAGTEENKENPQQEESVSRPRFEPILLEIKVRRITTLS
jgi:hypothetical protein